MKLHPSVMQYISVTNNSGRDPCPFDRNLLSVATLQSKMPVPVLNRQQTADNVKRTGEQDRTGYFSLPLASLQEYRIRDDHIVTNQPFVTYRLLPHKQKCGMSVSGTGLLLQPHKLNFNRLRHLQGIIHFNTEITDCTFEFFVT